MEPKHTGEESGNWVFDSPTDEADYTPSPQNYLAQELENKDQERHR